MIGLLTWGLLSLFFGNPVQDAPLLAATLALLSLGLGLALGFVSFLAARAHSIPGLVAVLAFPVLIPLLLTANKLGAVATRTVQQTSTSRDLLVLAAIDLLIFGLASLLLPRVWRDA